MLAQEPCAEGVNRRDPCTFNLMTHLRQVGERFQHALPNLGRGLLGKRNGQNSAGRYVLLANEPGEALNQDAGFSGSWTSDYADVLPEAVCRSRLTITQLHGSSPLLRVPEATQGGRRNRSCRIRIPSTHMALEQCVRPRYRPTPAV